MRIKERRGILNIIIKFFTSLLKTIWKLFPTILFVMIIVMIYFVSPRVTIAIQNGAKFIYELDGIYITRIVELILAVTLIGAVSLTKKGE